MNRLEDARINEQRDLSGVSNVSIVSRAYEPSGPIFPKKKFMLMVTIIVGAITGVSAGFAAYYLDHTVKTPSDLLELTQVPVISSLGEVKQRKNNRS